jgi:hypothetical protein
VSRRQREEGSSPVVRDEILTTEEVCTLLKIKKATLYRHTSQETGPPFYKRSASTTAGSAARSWPGSTHISMS